MISEDIALAPDAVAYVPPAPPYVVLLASATICWLASLVPVIMFAYLWVVLSSMTSSRWTPSVRQPLQNCMLSGVVRLAEVTEGSQLTPDSPEMISTR